MLRMKWIRCLRVSSTDLNRQKFTNSRIHYFFHSYNQLAKINCISEKQSRRGHHWSGLCPWGQRCSSWSFQGLVPEVECVCMCGWVDLLLPLDGDEAGKDRRRKWTFIDHRLYVSLNLTLFFTWWSRYSFSPMLNQAIKLQAEWLWPLIFLSCTYYTIFPCYSAFYFPGNPSSVPGGWAETQRQFCYILLRVAHQIFPYFQTPTDILQIGWYLIISLLKVYFFPILTSSIQFL